MSARVTSSSVQNCLHRAVSALVGEIGTGRAAEETGSDPSTIRRHLASGGWDSRELSALIAYERQERGRSSIVEALAADVHGQTAKVAGQAIRLRDEEKLELQDNAKVDQAILADFDRSTPIGRNVIRAAIAERRRHEDLLLADLDAADGRVA